MEINETNRSHYRGQLITYNNKLVALGGCETRSVEVLKNEIWDVTQIGNVGNKEGILEDSTSIVIESKIFVFGEKKSCEIDSYKSRI